MQLEPKQAEAEIIKLADMQRKVAYIEFGVLISYLTLSLLVLAVDDRKSSYRIPESACLVLFFGVMGAVMRLNETETDQKVIASDAPGDEQRQNSIKNLESLSSVKALQQWGYFYVVKAVLEKPVLPFLPFIQAGMWACDQVGFVTSASPVIKKS